MLDNWVLPDRSLEFNTTLAMAMNLPHRTISLDECWMNDPAYLG
ncbi:hypothetical protein [Coleofasciculus sp. FACHB-1120]|nr:hypothetical protein [Coleofasciculus sp. FACHB-1120]